MMHQGDLLPRVDGATLDGRRLDYARVWQHRNLVLFMLPPERRAQAVTYLGDIEARLATLRPDDTVLAVSAPPSDEESGEAVVIADRWGEVVHAEPLPADPGEWPPPDDVVAWVEFIRVQCPECPP